jgi:hypothetical protein
MVGERFNAGHENGNSFDVEVNISGGTVGSGFVAHSGSTVNISGGTVGANFQAGHFNGTSTDVEVNITGGTVDGNFLAYPGSVVNISGGTIDRLAASSVVNISGGAIGENFLNNPIDVSDGGVVNISGGAFAGLGAKGLAVFNGGEANISGGAFTNADRNVAVYDGGEIDVFGTSFLLDGVAIEGLLPGEPLTITQRGVSLSGLLADGSPFSIDLNPSDPFPADGDWVHPGATLRVALPLPGDFDGNGIVEGADLKLWQAGFGQFDGASTLAAPRNGDADGDRDADGADFLVWQRQLGNETPSATSVPEPATLPLLVSGTLAMSAARAARRGRRPNLAFGAAHACRTGSGMGGSEALIASISSRSRP